MPAVDAQHAGADRRWRVASGDAAGGRRRTRTGRSGRQLPALASVAHVGGSRPGAQILAVAVTAGGTPQPLIAAQRYGQGRSVVFAGEASWRWRMMRPATDTSYETIWRQLARWVTAGAQGR